MNYPAPNKKEIFNKDYFYGRKLSNYVNYEKLDNDFRWKPIVKILKELKISGKILDIGCAFGYFLKRAAPLFQELYGLDISDFAIKLAKKELPKAELRVLDIDKAELPYPDEYFDLITAFDVLEHTSSIPGALNKIIKKIKRGGYLIFSTPMKNTWAGRIFRFFDRDVSHISVPTKLELIGFVEQSGLEIIKQNSFINAGYFRIYGIPQTCEFVLRKR